MSWDLSAFGIVRGYLGSWGNCFGGAAEEGNPRQPSCFSKWTYGLVKTGGELPVCLATTAFCVSGIWYGVCVGKTSYAVGSFVLAGGTSYSWYELRQFAYLQGFDEQNIRFEGNNQALEGNIQHLANAVKSVEAMDRSLTQGRQDQAANNQVAAQNNRTLQEQITEIETFVAQLFETKKAVVQERDKIKALIKQMVANANQARATHEGLSDEVDELDESNEDLEENIAKLEEFQGSLAGTYQRIRQEREQLSSERELLATEVDELQNTEAGLSLGVTRFRETERKLEETEQRLTEALSRLEFLKQLEDLVPALTKLAGTVDDHKDDT